MERGSLPTTQCLVGRASGTSALGVDDKVGMDLLPILSQMGQ